MCKRSSFFFFSLLLASSVLAQDTTSPIVSYRYPQAGASVSRLTEIQVQFNERVAGVDAADLTVNSVPCTNVFAFGQDVYVFQFSQPATGMVQVAFAVGHGIQDLAVPPNAFAGSSWTYNLDTNIPPATVIISEFLASNSGSGTNALRDEDGDGSDWIEIRNFGPTTVSLEGWFLTDAIGDLTQWRFPAGVTIAADGYLVVFASGKNRTNATSRLHTRFQLAAGGEYLGLVNPLRQVASQFNPYPSQQTDVSYGRDQANPDVVGYFLVPTPGAPNLTSGPGFAPEVQFSRSSGAFATPFELTLSTTDPMAVIRYTTNDAPVASTSQVYTSSILINGSVRVRARAFSPPQGNLFPGPIHSESYVLLSPSIADFTSDLPVVILHTFGNVNVSAGAGVPDTPATVTIIEPDRVSGRTVMTNAPSVATRAGINLRGSSTQGLNKRNLAVEYWNEANTDIEIETLGMPAESDWVLYPPNGFDHPLIHNPFIYEVSRQVGRYASRTRFVELFYKIDAGGVVSNNYFGLYVLTEKIKIDNNRVEIPNLAPEETNAPAVTGGYLFLINSGRVDANEIAINVPPQGQQVIYQDPEGPDIRRPERRPQEIYITNYLFQMANVLRAGNADFTNLVTGYHAWVDVDSWIDHHILNVLGRNVDAIRLSGYFYKDRNRKLEFGPIWDFDRSMGTGKPDETDITYRSYNPREWLNQAAGDRGTDFFRYATHQWWGRLFEDVDFWQRYIDRWQELRRGVFTTDNLFAVIDGMTNEIREAQRRDQARWAPPVNTGANSTTPRSGTITANGYTHTFDGTYSGEIAFLKRWLTERMDFVDTNFLGAPVLFGMPGPVTNGYSLSIGPPARPPGSTIYYTLDGTDPRLPGGGVSPTALVYIDPIIVTTNVRVFARAFNPNHRNIINANCPNGGCPPLSTPWSGPAVGSFYLSVPPLRITEIMYHPVGPPAGNTNDQDFYEFLEVKNIGGTPLNVNRFRIRGGLDFDLPNEILAPGEQAVIVRDLAAFRERYGSGPRVLGVYTNDNLANDGDHLVLEGSVHEPILDFNYDDDWYPTTDGHGFSLQIVNDGAAPDNWGLKASWRPSGVINGTPSAADPGAPGIATVYVNEASTHTDPSPADAIELYNPTAGVANLGGWFLTDDFRTPDKYRIPNNTMIAANSYLVFYQSNSFGTGPDGFALSSHGDEVYLFSADAGGNLTGWMHGYSFGPQANGVTFGRYITSLGQDRFVTQASPTLGATNSGPKVGPVVISEINYHPPDFRAPHHPVDNDQDEYIELQNISGADAPLYDPVNPGNTWQLRDAVDFVFPIGAMVPANGFILVVGFDPTNTALLEAFRQANGVPIDTPVYGPWSGKLDNSMDSIELVRPDLPEPPGSSSEGLVSYILVERVEYEDVLPWPVGLPDGLGAVLGRIDSFAYGDDPVNWRTAPKTPGAPLPSGGTPPTIVTQPVSTSGIESQSASFTLSATGSSLGYIWTFKGEPLPSAPSAPTLTLSGLSVNQAGVYACYVFNAAGSVLSSNATLTVRQLPRITLHPTNRAAWIKPDPRAVNTPDGTNVTFVTAATTLEPPILYQWRFNGTNIPGATSATLVVTNVQLEDEGDYYCVVTDGVAPVPTAGAHLTPLIQPLVVQAPLGMTVVEGSDFSHSVEIIGNPAPFGYSWRRALPSATLVSNYVSARSNFITLNSTAAGLVLAGGVASSNYEMRLVLFNEANLTPGVLIRFTNMVVADFDRDGVPDTVETALGLAPNDPADGAGDLDGDGMNNRAEYVAGTDLANPASYLRITSITAGGGATLTFGAMSNKTYTIQYTDRLGSGAWTRLKDIFARTTNRTETVFDPIFTTNRSYRVATPSVP